MGVTEAVVICVYKEQMTNDTPLLSKRLREHKKCPIYTRISLLTKRLCQKIAAKLANKQVIASHSKI